MRACGLQQRVAVGFGLQDAREPDLAGGTAHVLDDERLAEALFDPALRRPHHDVGGPAGRKRNDDPDRPRWKGFRAQGSGHAAAPARNVMNARRRMSHSRSSFWLEHDLFAKPCQPLGRSRSVSTCPATAVSADMGRRHPAVAGLQQLRNFRFRPSCGSNWLFLLGWVTGAALMRTGTQCFQRYRCAPAGSYQRQRHLRAHRGSVRGRCRARHGSVAPHQRSRT